MATLYVRGIPEDLYEQLRRQAAQDGRSINAEAIVMLRRALHDATLSQRDLLTRIQARLEFSPAARGAPVSLDLLREDRER